MQTNEKTRETDKRWIRNAAQIQYRSDRKLRQNHLRIQIEYNQIYEESVSQSFDACIRAYVYMWNITRIAQEEHRRDKAETTPESYSNLIGFETQALVWRSDEEVS